MLLVFFLIVVIVVILFALRFQQAQELVRMATQFVTQQTQQTQQMGQVGLEEDKKNLQRLVQGCFGDNVCVPLIDNPKFVSARQAKFLKPDDLVIGIFFEDSYDTRGNFAKAYPVKILNWHEMVAPEITKVGTLLVTYSSLSMTPRVFLVNMMVPEDIFRVSGMILNSSPVLYNSQTKSFWSQFDGIALTGPQIGKQLGVYPSQLIRWSDWVQQHPKTTVLSQQTGFDFDYEQTPYGDYEKTTDIYFPLENTDSRLKPKELVFGIEVDGRFKAYPESELKKVLPKGGIIYDEFSGMKFQLKYEKNVLKILDTAKDLEFPNAVSYYFVWSAFHPDTEIYRAPAVSTSAKTQSAK